ncbi:hypothetical protein [Nitrincola nitratireducens]|uniref:VCBS repeat-containing protein n=1 Tax=Nitrincola nitratireducens TaxID=1229521 RepID=W9V088_9GAMM|nr:hypothetical protein [Nitrincola nitratireducens]EXJ12759.1 hypothetical protein D791_00100 [Nitrincola nitratireducens]
MRIEASQINMKSGHASQTRYERAETLTTERRQTNVQGEESTQRISITRSINFTSKELITYSDLRKRFGESELEPNNQVPANIQNQSTANTTNTGNVSADAPFRLELSSDDRVRLLLIQQLMKTLTGKEFKMQLFDARPFKSDIELPFQPLPTTPPQVETVSFQYQRHETFYQAENTHFNATGIVKTADGRSIDISLELNLSRELVQHNSFMLRVGQNLIDPLVINFNGHSAELTETRFEFDLTLDGRPDLIPSLGANSAFLALDKNNDGIINDGSELFGAITGDGFNELAAYDDDNNGWIDENDEIFQHLKLWVHPGNSDSQQLMTLSEAGIGAIYLGNAKTPFSLLQSGDSNLLGMIQSTGIYLSEDGRVGTIQHVDLTV